MTGLTWGCRKTILCALVLSSPASDSSDSLALTAYNDFSDFSADGDESSPSMRFLRARGGKSPNLFYDSLEHVYIVLVDRIRAVSA